MTELNPYTAPNPQPEGDPPLVAQLSTDKDGMTVEFEQTLDDVLALQYYTNRAMGIKTPPRWLGILFAVLVLLMAAIVYLVVTNPALAEFDGLLSTAVWLLLVCIAMCYGVPYGTRWAVRLAIHRFMRKGHNLNLIGLRRITITPQFVVASSPVTQTISRWIGVEKVVVEDGNLFIFLSTLSAYVLPRRAFSSEQHFREFAATAEKYLRQ